MLKPSGGFFKKMFNPGMMKRAQKKPVTARPTAKPRGGGIFGGIGKALGAGFGGGRKKPMPSVSKSPAMVDRSSPRPQTPSASPRVFAGGTNRKTPFGRPEVR